MQHVTIPHRVLFRIADGLIRWRVSLLLLAVGATLLAIPVAERLQTDESVESFFSNDDPLLVAYRDSKAWFGGDEFVMVAYEDSDPTSQEHLTSLREFVEQLNAVPGVRAESTQSLESLLRPKFSNSFVMRVVARAFTKKNQDEILAFGEHIVISHDRKSTNIVLRLMPEGTASTPRSETFREVRRLAAEHNPPAAVAGEPIQVHDMFRYVDEDNRVLSWASSGLLMLLILLLFRALRWVVLPLLVVHVTLIWTKAILVLMGIESSMVSSMLTSLMTIIGLATVMHVTVLYRERRKSRDRFDAFRETLIVLGPPTFWTCLTTAIGFGALMSSQISPVRNFAWMMVVGTMLILVAVAVILPGGVLIGMLWTDPRHTPAEHRLLACLDRVSHGLDRRPKLWLAVMLVLMAATGLGLPRLQVETDFSKNFRRSTPIVQSLEFFEQRFGGAGTWEVNFPMPGELNDESLDSIRKLSADLRAIRLADGTQLTKVVSLSDGVDFAPGNGARQQMERLAMIQPEFIPSLYEAQTGHMRIMLRAQEQQPAEVKLRLIDEATQVARRHFPEARATGLYVLLANLVSSVLQDQLVSFVLATIGVFVCMTIAFRSLWIGLISLVPNLFPLLLVIGGMGWTGLPINLGTAMIASISMGLTVDSSIHYLSGYLRARERGASHSEAVRLTHGGVGKTLIFAYLVLVLGFLVLTLSNFIPLVYFGALVSLSMIGGLIGDLVLLPLLLKYVPPRTSTAERPVGMRLPAAAPLPA